MNHRGRVAFVALTCTRFLGAMLIAFCLERALPATAAETPGDFLTDVWTADDGLPDSSVTAIAQTADGYLWVGTQNGVARFDGLRFVVFDPANTPALTHARVRKLSVDHLGGLWVNTFDGSLTSLRQGIFEQEWVGSEGLDPDVMLLSSVSNQITFLLHRGLLRRKALSSPAGVGWEDIVPTNRVVGAQCVKDGAGTVWYRGLDKRLWRLNGKIFEALPPGLGPEGTRVNCLTLSPDHCLWIGTDAGIAFWNGSRFQNATPTNSESGPDVAFLSVVEKDVVWAVTDGQVRKAVNREWILEVEALRNVFTGSLSRLGAHSDHHGGVWFYDYGRGLMHIGEAGDLRQFGARDGFPGERVNCFFEDREGNWWAGLDAGGIVRIRERRFRTIDTSTEISTKPAKSVCQETNGTVWIGTLGDGLARWQDGAVTSVPMSGGTGRGFAFCISPDSEGRLWASAGDEDLFVREHGEFRRVTPVVHGVKAILADKSSRIWVGTKSGLFVGEGQPPRFRLHEGIRRTDIRALCEDRRGNLWAGAEDGTLFCITNNVAIAYRPSDLKTSHAIWSLLADDEGSIWVGTFRGGLLRFREGKFTRFSVSDGLPDDIICQILPDGLGNFWLGSHHGIFRVAEAALHDFAGGVIKSLPCTVYGRSDGLPSLECSGGYQPAAWPASDGRLWFATLKGAVWVKPGEIRRNLLPPPVAIEEVFIDGKAPDAAITPQRNSGAIHHGDVLRVPPGRHQLEFRYTGLSLISPEQVKFRYRLEGADDQWVEAGTRRSAQYSYLPPGNYQFHVMASNSDGVWNEIGSMLAVKILPRFYETIWFRVLFGIVVVATAVGSIRQVTTRRLRQKMEKLERQHAVERERSRIAKDIHDDLGASLTLIAVLGDLAKKEKSGERLEKMSATARQAIKSLDEIVWAVNPRNDTLSHLIDYAGQFATDYLRSAGIRCLLDLPEQTPAREVPANVRHNVFLVIKEALQNIVKHARATQVWLRMAASDQGLRIVIEDNGCGFESAPENGWADGLRNMRQRLTEVGGECRIESQVGQGTVITVELPWPAS